MFLTISTGILSSYKTGQIFNIHFKSRIKYQMELYRGRNFMCPAWTTCRSCQCPAQSSDHCWQWDPLGAQACTWKQASKGSGLDLCSHIRATAEANPSISPEQVFSSGASCFLSAQCKQIDHVFASPSADWQSGCEINGFPVQQRPPCTAAEFNMQTSPPWPQTHPPGSADSSSSNP